MPPVLAQTWQVTGSSASALTTPSFTPGAGDVLVVKAAANHSTVTVSAPTGGGLPYGLNAYITTADYCPTRLYTATVGFSPTAMTVSVTFGGSGLGSTYLIVERWTSASLAASPETTTVEIGAAGIPVSTTIPTAAANSAVSWIVADWLHVSGTAAYRSGATQNGISTTSTGNYYSATQPAVVPGTQTVGMTSPIGQKWTLLGVEVQAGVSGPAPEVPIAPPVGADALQRRTLAEVRGWQDWLDANDAEGVVGEFGCVTLAGVYGNPTEQALWNDLLDTYLTDLDAAGVASMVWASGRQWDSGYPLGVHVPATQGAALSLTNGTGDVIAGHPSRQNGVVRGVNVSGWENGVSPNGGGTVRTAPVFVPTSGDFAYLAAAGVDTVRLPMSWERVQPTLGGALDSAALTTLDAILTAARTNNVDVIVELHNFGRYTQADGTILALGGALSNLSFADVWTRLATWVRADTNRSSTVVGYGLMNEPHDLVGGAPSWEAASQAAVNAVRAAGDTRTIMVGGYGWSSLVEWTANHPYGWITDPAGDFRYEGHHYWDTKSALGSRSGTYQQSPTGPILTYELELRAAQQAEDEAEPPPPVDPETPNLPAISESAWDVAITSATRMPLWRLVADWNRDGEFDHPLSDLSGLVEEITVDRDLVGALPPEVGLIEGYSSASLSVTLGGHWPSTPLDAAEVFAPYRGDSPLYGRPLIQTPLTFDTGFVTDEGVRYDRRFTGTVRRINPTSSSRTVKVDGLDPANRLHAPISLPATAMDAQLLARYGPDTYRSRMNTAWVIDHILRRNGYFASPPPRDDAVLSVTMHGSAIPEIGWGGKPDEIYSTFRGAVWDATVNGEAERGAPHPFNMLCPLFDGPIGRWWLQSPLTAAPGEGVGVSMWMEMRPGDGVGHQMFYINVSANQTVYYIFGVSTLGRPYFGVHLNGTLYYSVPTVWPAATIPTWCFVGGHASFTETTMTVTWRISGNGYTDTYAETVTGLPRRTVEWTPSPFLAYDFTNRVTNFQMWSDAAPPEAGPWQGEEWTSQADIDPGANELTGVPELSAVDSWALIQSLCAAEGSSFGFSETGRPWFRTRAGDDLRDELPVTKEIITADRNLSDLVATTDEASIRNVVNIKTTNLLVTGWQDFFTSPDVNAFDSEPGTTYFEVQLPSSAYELPPPRSGQGSGNYANSSHWPGGDGFVFYSTSENWTNLSKLPEARPYIRLMMSKVEFPTEGGFFGGINVRVTRVSPWKALIVVVNNGPFAVRFATPDKVDETSGEVTPGEPAFIMPARIAEPGVEQVETYYNAGSIETYGESTFDVGGSGGVPSGTRPLLSRWTGTGSGSGATWQQTPEGLRGLAAAVLATTAHPVPVLDAVDVPHDPRRRLGDRIVLADPDGLGTVAAHIVGLSSTFASDGARDKITVRPVAPPGLGLLDDPVFGLCDSTLILAP